MSTSGNGDTMWPVTRRGTALVALFLSLGGAALLAMLPFWMADNAAAHERAVMEIVQRHPGWIVIPILGIQISVILTIADALIRHRYIASKAICVACLIQMFSVIAVTLYWAREWYSSRGN